MNMRSLFITGSSGFIGAHLLRRLNAERYRAIYCLTRGGSRVINASAYPSNVIFIQASLDDVTTYAPYLADSDIVIHLAAATGKVKRDEYFYVNTHGTEDLIKQCQQLGVRQFLHISSIAVKYSNAESYYYAQSKQRAEEQVRKSQVSHTILRPTLVVGMESGPWRSLVKHAKAPIIFIPGDGRPQIQPIYIDDLIEFMMFLIEEEIFFNETIEVGGPEVITIDNLLKYVHRLNSQKDPWVIHLPLGLIRPILLVFEKLSPSLLPFTVGQLSFFINDGTISENPFILPKLHNMKHLGEMLSIVSSNA